MPGVLKRDRVRALTSKKVGRYLLFGIGEIVLIFIGITLAVSFENSAEEERASELARGLLIGVQQDLDANAAELQDNIEIDQVFLASMTLVLANLDTSSTWPDSLSVELENALHWSSPFLSTSGYEGLKQAGLHRVPDEELRTGIVRLFERRYGFLLGDHDRAMWEFSQAVLRPLLGSELVRTDKGDTTKGAIAPRDYGATRERGALRTALLEQQNFLIIGLELRQEILTETLALRQLIDEFAGRDDLD